MKENGGRMGAGERSYYTVRQIKAKLVRWCYKLGGIPVW